MWSVETCLILICPPASALSRDVEANCVLKASSSSLTPVRSVPTASITFAGDEIAAVPVPISYNPPDVETRIASEALIRSICKLSFDEIATKPAEFNSRASELPRSKSSNCSSKTDSTSVVSATIKPL